MTTPATRSAHELTLSEFEGILWSAADALRGAVDASGYREYIFPLLFWKWISDDYTSTVDQLGADVPTHVIKRQVRFFLPEGTCWEDVILSADATYVGARIKAALRAIEDQQATRSDGSITQPLKGLFGNPSFDDKDKLPADRLKRVLQVIGQIDFSQDQPAHDMLGAGYEYLMKRFADASGKKAGEFFTPTQVVRILAGIADPRPSEEVYDPTSGSGGILLEAAKTMERKTGYAKESLHLYGQEINSTTYALSKMNMFVHGINNSTILLGDTLNNPKHGSQDGGLRQFDVVLSNPPFSLEWDSGSWSSDPRNKWGLAPDSSADYAFVAHILMSMKDTAEARGAVVLPHGVLFRGGKEKAIREAILEEGLIEAVIGLPSKIFYGTGIPTCILVFRKQTAKDSLRKDSVLFVDGSEAFIKQGNMNELTDADVEALVATYRDGVVPESHEGKVRARLVPMSEIRTNDHDLSLNRYVSAEAEDIVDFATSLEAYQTARTNRLQSERKMQEAFTLAWGMMGDTHDNA